MGDSNETLTATEPSSLPAAVGRDSGTISPSIARAGGSTEAPIKRPLPATKAKRSRGTPAAVLNLIVAAIVGLSAWYLTRPTPLMIQGEADSTRIDIAARVDGRLSKLLVQRGEMVAAGQKLLDIDNPELLAKLDEAKAGKALAEEELARMKAGKSAETIDVRKGALEQA